MGTIKIAIDAGHGIDTAGKRSPDRSFFEYEFNRDVTDRLKKILENHGIEIILTAATKYDTSLKERCRIANDANADLLISIHANAFGTGWNDANGWEIYILSRGGEAEKLAKSIELESEAMLGLKNRGTKTASFYMIRETKMPAVLIEHGFFTNKEECDKLLSDSFRQLCAEADAKGILNYLDMEYKDEEEEDGLGCSDWAEEYCQWAVDNDIITGTGNGYGWDENITKEQACAIMKRLYDLIVNH